MTQLSKTIISVTIYLIGVLAILQIKQPQVVVKNGMVVQVDGKPTHREVGKWDRLESNIIYK